MRSQNRIKATPIVRFPGRPVFDTILHASQRDAALLGIQFRHFPGCLGVDRCVVAEPSLSDALQ